LGEKMSLVLTGRIDLPENSGAGGFDHAAIHKATNRLYVAHTINDGVDIIDCTTDRYLTSIPGLSGVAGVLASDERNQVFTSNRGENTVSIFTPGDEQNRQKIPVGIRPNGLAFDPHRGLLLVANVGDPETANSFTLSILDIQKGVMIHSIPVPGRTRWAVFFPERDEFFINISEPAQICVVGAGRADRIARMIKVPASGPHGLDFDSASGRLWCACDDGNLICLEAGSGKVLNMTKLSGKPDVIFYNPALKRLYVAVGDPGVIDVLDTVSFKRVESVATGRGTHTMAFETRLNKNYAFVPENHCALVYRES
jgi:DNA-binding beta-propeller fold protein YncE